MSNAKDHLGSVWSLGLGSPSVLLSLAVMAKYNHGAAGRGLPGMALAWPGCPPPAVPGLLAWLCPRLPSLGSGKPLVACQTWPPIFSQAAVHSSWSRAYQAPLTTALKC